MKITAYFMKFMPLVIFCSISSMILTTGLSTIISVIGLLFTLWTCCIVLNFAYCLVLKFCAGLNPAAAYRKSLPFLITGFTTCSSNACLPDMINSAKSMGVSPKLYSFSLPLGVSINKVAICVSFAAFILSASYMYGINISFGSLVSLGVSSIILTVATPGLPGAVIISMSVLLAQAGIPMEFLAIVMSIDTLRDIIATPSNCKGCMTCTLLTAEKEKLIDFEAYNRS